MAQHGDYVEAAGGGQSGVYKELVRPSGLQASSFLQTALTAVSLFTFASKAVREPLEYLF